MKNLVNLSGGALVLSDSFCSSVFKQSCFRLFEKASVTNSQGPPLAHLKMGFNAMMEVHVSKELRISGLIGPAISLAKKNTAMVSDIVISTSLCSTIMCYSPAS